MFTVGGVSRVTAGQALVHILSPGQSDKGCEETIDLQPNRAEVNVENLVKIKRSLLFFSSANEKQE